LLGSTALIKFLAVAPGRRLLKILMAQHIFDDAGLLHSLPEFTEGCFGMGEFTGIDSEIAGQKGS
jgi:hypothetical protein